jgi:hypothetical protein
MTTISASRLHAARLALATGQASGDHEAVAAVKAAQTPKRSIPLGEALRLFGAAFAASPQFCPEGTAAALRRCQTDGTDLGFIASVAEKAARVAGLSRDKPAVRAAWKAAESALVPLARHHSAAYQRHERKYYA